MKSILRRAGWLFLAVLFIVTGLGVGVWAFWENTHPAKPDTSQQQTADSNNCVAGQPVTNQASLPAPEAFKPDGQVTTLGSTDLKPGSGPAAKSGDCLTVKYYGTLASNGQKFDENFTTTDAFRFKLGAGSVIQGWDQGLIGMKAGGDRRLVIPAALAYGSQSPSPSIPANSDLVFVVHLISIQ